MNDSGAVYAWLRIQFLLALAHRLLGLARELLRLALQLLAGVAGGATYGVADPAFDDIGRSLQPVLRALSRHVLAIAHLGLVLEYGPNMPDRPAGGRDSAHRSWGEGVVSA